MEGASEYRPPSYLSPSSVGTFRQCPLRYRLSRLDQVPEPSTPEQLRGSFVHEILEKLYEFDPEQRTVATARGIASDLWAGKWAEHVHDELHLSEHDLRGWRWHAWWCIEEYFALEDPQEVHPDGLETRLEGTVADVPFVGIIDRWSVGENGRATVTDYKTGKAPAPRYAEDKVFQLMVYADMLNSHKGLDVETVELIYLKTPGQIARYQPSDTQMTKMRKTVIAVWEQVNEACSTGVFEPKPSRLCDWCNYKSICPAFTMGK